jgi:DnaD/phage-associated family protein
MTTRLLSCGSSLAKGGEAMAKDPAFLFYSNDFLTGTFTMSDKQVGQYIRLMCLQHQQGHLTEEKMLSVCKKVDPDIWAKFKQDENGLFYNERLETEVTKRIDFCESRRNNKKGKTKNICESYENHMSVHMENEIVVVNNNVNKPTVLEGTKDAREEISKVMNFFETQTNSLPSPTGIQLLIEYTKDMGSEVVCRAIEISVDAKAGNWRYVEKILQEWTRKKVKTLADVDRIEAERNAIKNSYSGRQNNPPARKSFAQLAEEMEANHDGF